MCIRDRIDARLCAPARPRHATHEHHPRRRRRCAARPHLPADGRAEALRRQGWRIARTQVQRSLLCPDGIPGRARPPLLRRGPGPARGGRSRRTEARAHDGQHLSQPAPRDRGRRLSCAAPAHLADADPQALDRDADQLARALVSAPGEVAVIGAGWSGLAAAVECAAGGSRVTLFEMAPIAGGRARDAGAAGEGLDNGQHICIGAYRETLRLMARLGVAEADAFVRLPLRLVDAEGIGLRLPPGPPGLAFARGVLRHRRWTWRDRFALLRTALGWQRSGFRCDARSTVAELCASLPEPVRHELVEPLCVAALNTPAESASATV